MNWIIDFKDPQIKKFINSNKVFLYMKQLLIKTAPQKSITN